MANKCSFRKKDGSRCGANAQPANGLCVFHDPARAADGRRARKAGGIHRSRAAAVLPSDTPDHPLGNSKDVSELLANSINQLRRGQLDPKVATCVGYLSTVLLRALEQGPTEQRLTHLESILGKGSSDLPMFEFRPARKNTNET
jgi:hypothetical protein